MMRILLGWAINAGVLLLLPYLVPAVQLKDFPSALLAALVLGLVNAVVRPILVVLTLPITLLTLGLFLFVLNGLMFWLVARWLDGFSVDGFWWAVLAAFVYSVISTLVSSLLLRKNA
jgi:putative membrane protein